MTAVDPRRVRELDDRTAATARAARRLTGGAAAIGAALLASLQLAQLGAVAGSLRIVIAGCAAALAVGAVVVAVTVTVRVMLPRTASVHQLADREAADEHARRRDPLIAYIHRNGLTLLRGPCDSVRQLAADYGVALAARHDAVLTINRDDDESDMPAATAADARAAELNANVVYLLATARMEDTRRTHDTAARALALLLATLVLALIGLSWALHPPAQPTADLRGADLTGVSLRDVELRGAVLDGMTIERADLRGTYLGEASIDKTTWVDTLCPDGVNSDNAGRTCAGHLEP